MRAAVDDEHIVVEAKDARDVRGMYAPMQRAGRGKGRLVGTGVSHVATRSQSGL